VSFSEELSVFYNPPEEDLVCFFSADMQVRALRLVFTVRILLFVFADLKGV
jgi:hypothetical protein